jgi:hypothetical protein
MFKILALIGAIAGGTTYGLYAHTNLLDHNCPFSAGNSCCQGNGDVTPSCCPAPCADGSKGSDESCDVSDLCSSAASAVVASTQTPSAAYPPCCSSKVALVSARKVACYDVSAEAAVAGPAAVVADAVRK